MSKVKEVIWTVVRFPNGSWSYGGRPNDPDYEDCEVYRVLAQHAKQAVKKAQSKRSRLVSKQQPLPTAIAPLYM